METRALVPELLLVAAHLQLRLLCRTLKMPLRHLVGRVGDRTVGWFSTCSRTSELVLKNPSSTSHAHPRAAQNPSFPAILGNSPLKEGVP